MTKIDRNKQLDMQNVVRLKLQGWRVLVIYECELMREKAEVILSEILSVMLNT
jgi:G:T-mismatch repair DNA endonuclease (very short patch repair protein)